MSPSDHDLEIMMMIAISRSRDLDVTMSRCHDLVMSRNHEIMESLEIMSRWGFWKNMTFWKITILLCLVFLEITVNPRILPSNGVLGKGVILGAILGVIWQTYRKLTFGWYFGHIGENGVIVTFAILVF